MIKEIRLKNFPISFFSVILGLAGFAIAWQKMENILWDRVIISNYLVFFAGIIFVIISLFYALKITQHYNKVWEEFHNPIKLSFFPTFSISLILLAIGFLEINELMSKYLWILGTLVHFILTLKILSIWFFRDYFKLEHFSPAWFIPVVGNMLIPIVGVHHFNVELSWFFFSIGIFFWLILLIIVLYRIIFHTAILTKMVPTFFILIAPPAIAFIAYVKLTDQVDAFAKLLYYFALFLAIFLLANVKKFVNIEFYLSWWAYSFPLAAITIASVLMFLKTNFIIFSYIALAFLTILSFLILFLLIKTARCISKHKICIEE